MLPLPSMPPTPNERTLASKFVDRITNVATSTFALSQHPIAGYEQVYKNGALLDPSTQYTLVGNTVTLAIPLVTTDIVLAHYHYRQVSP